jgi:hypothetical protein
MVDIFGDDDARETCWDIVSSDTTGPLLPFTSTSGCCGAARRSRHSCRAQHFVDWNIGQRTNRTCADAAIADAALLRASAVRYFITNTQFSLKDHSVSATG